MLCDQCTDLLSDYIDGSLELGEQTKVEHHVGECEHCRGIRDDLLQIVQFSRKLPLHTPPSALWHRIKAEIELEARPNIRSKAAMWWSSLRSPGPSQGFHWAAAAATLVTVAALVVVMQTGVIFRSTPSRSGPDSSGTPIQNAQPATADETDINDMKQRIQALDDLAKQRSVSWSPDVKSAFNRDMSYLDQTLAQCHHELSDNPHDDVCREMMLNAYREKVRLLEGFTDY
ncbi:MAG TPA: zf-HC2 domain-containing protein [Blastocatellia bacterium]|nr:zf-HC2 domain-containing protein [Blastocatellia bacterium]